MRVLLEDSSPKLQRLELQDDKNGFGFKILISARRLGHDTGKDIIIDCADHLLKIRDQARGRMRQPTKEELKALTEIAFSKPKKEMPKKQASSSGKQKP